MSHDSYPKVLGDGWAVLMEVLQGGKGKVIVQEIGWSGYMRATPVVLAYLGTVAAVAAMMSRLEPTTCTNNLQTGVHQ